MKQYLLSIYQPDGPPPATVNLEQIMRDVGAVQHEMVAAGVAHSAACVADRQACGGQRDR